MDVAFIVIGFLAMTVLLAYRTKRGVVIAAVVSVTLALPVLLVFRVAYPPDCLTRDAATAEQVADGLLCSKMQQRLHNKR